MSGMQLLKRVESYVRCCAEIASTDKLATIDAEKLVYLTGRLHAFREVLTYLERVEGQWADDADLLTIHPSQN